VGEEDDEKYLKFALRLAEKGRGKTSPNPMVGAIIVKDGRIAGRGYHKKAGSPHAEINALKEARGEACGATMYVNLEPCCHYGRTKPCTDEIIKAGVKEVVLALKDPNPLVNGKGIAQLRKAGIRVRMGGQRNEARKLNEVYLKYISTGRPFVVLKMAQTLDGRIATVSGDSRWISAPETRKYVHKLRAEYDAVAVGAGTVLADNPRLTVRSVKGKNPYRIIVSRHPAFPRSINLFKNNGDAKTILATSSDWADRVRADNLITWTVREEKNGLSLNDLLDKAGGFGITSVLVEGGSRLATSFIEAALVDKYCLFIAPKIVGDGINAVGNLNIKRMARALTCREFVYDKSLEPDLLFIGYPERK
jgi:diaminohydroxyphosphoribosylaminopyrimidine deaminase/5-amino-6-(5-phosphoribosylamino)uracil reductase